MGSEKEMAERAGFEPAVELTPTHAFQACSFGHSDTSPRRHFCPSPLSTADRSRRRLSFGRVRPPGLGWRRGGDSNPRNPCEFTGFRNQPVRPLWHLSVVSPRHFTESGETRKGENAVVSMDGNLVEIRTDRPVPRRPRPGRVHRDRLRHGRTVRRVPGSLTGTAEADFLGEIRGRL